MSGFRAFWGLAYRSVLYGVRSVLRTLWQWVPYETHWGEGAFGTFAGVRTCSGTSA
jgi:hypothetical protein